MPKVYEEPDGAEGREIKETIASLLSKWYPGFLEAGVTITTLFVREVTADGECTGEPCLKHQGYNAQATIKINSYKDRVEGKADATLTIDLATWVGLNERERVALIDHELFHLKVRTKDGIPVRDDCGRPVLKIRLHDWQTGGFGQIVKRHQDAAPEAKAFMDLNVKFKQLEFNFG